MATIVIRSKTKERISGTSCVEYSIHCINRSSAGTLTMTSRLVTKKKANETIKRLGLVESYSTISGQIYDTPDRACKDLFPNGLERKEEINLIEKADRI